MIFKLQKNFKEPKQQCGYSTIGDQGLTLELDPVHLKSQNGMAVLSTSIISTWIKIREIPATQNNYPMWSLILYLLKLQSASTTPFKAR